MEGVMSMHEGAEHDGVIRSEQPIPVQSIRAPEEILIERGTGFAVYIALAISVIKMLGLPEVFKAIRASQEASRKLYADIHALLPAALKALESTSMNTRRIRRFMEKHGDADDRDYDD
jgi:hypothetical protein